MSVAVDVNVVDDIVVLVVVAAAVDKDLVDHVLSPVVESIVTDVVRNGDDGDVVSEVTDCGR